jgi:predicted permease
MNQVLRHYRFILSTNIMSKIVYFINTPKQILNIIKKTYQIGKTKYISYLWIVIINLSLRWFLQFSIVRFLKQMNVRLLIEQE